MKLVAAIVGVGALGATDAFLPVTPVTGSFGVSKNVIASSVSAAPVGRSGDVVMLLGGGGGSKNGGIPKGLSSKIANFVRGSKGKG